MAQARAPPALAGGHRATPVGHLVLSAKELVPTSWFLREPRDCSWQERKTRPRPRPGFRVLVGADGISGAVSEGKADWETVWKGRRESSPLGRERRDREGPRTHLRRAAHTWPATRAGQHASPDADEAGAWPRVSAHSRFPGSSIFSSVEILSEEDARVTGQERSGRGRREKSEGFAQRQTPVVGQSVRAGPGPLETPFLPFPAGRSLGGRVQPSLVRAGRRRGPVRSWFWCLEVDLDSFPVSTSPGARRRALSCPPAPRPLFRVAFIGLSCPQVELLARQEPC